MLAQGYDLTKNAYTNRLQPYLAYWGVFWTIFFILVNGYAVFFHFNATDFLTACMYFFYVSSPWLIVVLTLVRHQYPYIWVLILWLQGYHAYQDLEAYRNGLCHCQSRSDDDDHEFSIDVLPLFFI